MGVIYIAGGYHTINSSKLDELQDERIDRIESIIDGSGDVENPEILNIKILNNSDKIDKNIQEIDAMNLNISSIEKDITGMQTSLNTIDEEIDDLNFKLDNLDTGRLQWVEV